MKTWLREIAAVAALAAVASAPVQAQEKALDRWSGTYLGINAGYAWGDSRARGHVPSGSNMASWAIDSADAVLNGNFNSDGGLAGLTFGVSRQTGQFVLGIEADFGHFGLGGKRDTGVLLVTHSVRGIDEISADWLATLRLRVGYAFGSSLIYATAGPAFSNASVSRAMDWSSDLCSAGEFGLKRCHAGKKDFSAGWTAGGGIEHALSDRWAIKAEYLYADFGEAKFTTVSQNFSSQYVRHSIDLGTHIARAGVNYKF